MSLPMYRSWFPDERTVVALYTSWLISFGTGFKANDKFLFELYVYYELC